MCFLGCLLSGLLTEIKCAIPNSRAEINTASCHQSTTWSFYQRSPVAAKAAKTSMLFRNPQIMRADNAIKKRCKQVFSIF